MEITETTVAEIEPPKDKPYVIVYDNEHRKAVPGFGVRVTKAGARSFIFNYRVRGSGTERRFTIGAASIKGSSGWKANEARKKADEMRRRVNAGEDPMGDLHAQRDAPTVGDLCKRYLEDHAPKKRSRRDDESLIKQFIEPELGSRKVAGIEHEDIRRLHRKISERGVAPPRKEDEAERRDPKPAPIRANRAATLLSKMFNLSIIWKMRADNPVKGLERNHEESRQRYLSGEELGRLTIELDKHEKRPSANVVRLLLLTGARCGEVLSARWGQFDLDQGVWTKPSAHTKQKRPHRVPISPPVQQLLVTMKAKAEEAAKKAKTESSPMLFPGQGENETQRDLKHFWATVCKGAKLSGVRIHDLRHTYASLLVSGGQSLPVIGALLGHTQPGTTARYAHLLDDPLRRATGRAAKIIEAAGKGKTAEVVDMPGAARA